MIGGVIFEEMPGLDSDSDGDVVYHSICNAITSLTGIPILTGIALELYRKDGYTDSQVYLEHGLLTLKNQKIVHLALSIEGKNPRFRDYIDPMRKKIAQVMHLELSQVGISAISGDGLTDFGCGDGLQCFCILSSAETV
jgi:2-C-methyl-D-erythritol 2,4-cyclodiphosphate synthase